tara:strand:+ start:4886 stop:5125 length:240 start_codon:yes stop_codon:yes gene_type:complete
MDTKLGQKHPDPSLIRLYITKAMLETTEKEIAETKDGEAANLTFGAKSTRVIEEAINKACSDFDKHGIFAGIIKDKEDA